MSVFRLQFVVFILSIFVISFGIFCLLELKQQYKYNYIQYNSAALKNINILSYKVKFNIDLIKKKFFYKDKGSRLPLVSISISKNSLNYLRNGVPVSNKHWQKAILRNTGDNEDLEIRIRPRGDNPANWAFNKKSWKVKIRKKNFYGGTRSFAYVVPRINEHLGIDFYSSYLISKNLGLLTPNIRFVELHLNGVPQGYYYEIEETDENFLRNNNMMPVNIYKGENYHVDFKIDIDDNLFNNSQLWTKKSIFNQRKDKNTDDLDLHLKQIKSFGNGSISPNIFFDYFPLDKWAKEFLSGGNGHTSNLHNQRLMIDEWSGEATRVMHDPLLFSSVINGEIDIARDSLEKTFALDPLFNYTKYKYHEYYFKNKIILSKVVQDINNQKKELINSINDDFHYKYFSKIKTREEIASIIDNFIDKLTSSSENFNYDREIKTTWNFSNKKLNINLFDNLPIGNIKIVLKDNLENLNSKIILKTNNKFYKKQIIPYKFENKELVLKATLLADRIRVSDYEAKRSKCCISNSLMIRPTKFSFILNNKISFSDIDKIYIENIFTKKFQKINFSKKNGFNPASHNYAIIIDDENNPKIFSGNIYYKNENYKENKLTKNIIINEESIIKPGTKFFLGEGVNILFKKKVIFNGTKEKPIIFDSINTNNTWGTVALIGNKTKGSRIKYTKFKNGSGGKVNNYLFTGMLSIHNTNNIKIQNLHLSDNKKFDDMMHIVYVDNLQIKDSKFINSKADAIDIDSSKNINIQNIIIENSGNDCLDFMQTNARIKSVKLSLCKDKGISVGERSNIIIEDIIIDRSNIGIVSKDDSIVNLNKSFISNNVLGLSAFKKNWRYGNGGEIIYSNTKFYKNKNQIKTDKYSRIN